jgi:hypothetical protein
VGSTGMKSVKFLVVCVLYFWDAFASTAWCWDEVRSGAKSLVAKSEFFESITSAWKSTSTVRCMEKPVRRPEKTKNVSVLPQSREETESEMVSVTVLLIVWCSRFCELTMSTYFLFCYCMRDRC